MLGVVDPIVIAAVQAGPSTYDKDARAILIGEGLATESTYSWLDWTATGAFLASLLEEAMSQKASEFHASEEPGEVPKKNLSVADAVASLRDEAKARGGDR